VRLLSVIIPVYNRRELVVDALVSVLNQNLPSGWDLELLVVDDGSTDGTGTMLESLRAAHPRLRIISRARGGTPGGARNAGVERSRGELLAFLDSDDRWLPGKVDEQVPLHERDGYELTHTRERWLRNGREVSQAGKRLAHHRRSGDLLEDALVKCIIGPSTVMMSRRLWEETGGFRSDLEVAEDYEYWLRLVTITEVGYLEKPLTEKRAGHGDQLSEKYGQIEVFRLAGLRDLVESRWFAHHRDQEAQLLACRELARKAGIYAAGARKRGRNAVADRFEELSLRAGRGDFL
jgi:glycosyltransferase involved in cell wall biosynthesis